MRIFFFFGSWGPRTLSDLQVYAFLFISHRNIPSMECPSWPCPDKCLFIPKTSVIMSPLRSLLDFCLLQAELTTPAFVLLQLLMLSFVTEIITLWHNNVLPDFFHQAAVSWSKWILAFPSWCHWSLGWCRRMVDIQYMFSEWINAFKTFTLSLGIKITIRLRKTTNAECLGCFRKKGALIKYYFETSSLHLSLSPRKDGEDRQLQFHARPSLFSSMPDWGGEGGEGERVGQESDCWGISRAAVK